MYVTWKLRGSSTFGKHLLVFSVMIRYIGGKFPVALTANVAVIYLLLSATNISSFLVSFKLNVYFPGDT